jgi:hypothetical protein
MKDIRGEAITINMFYDPGKSLTRDDPGKSQNLDLGAQPEPFSERTPTFKNIHLSSITGDADQAAMLLGLAESPLDDVSLSDMHLTAKKGITIKDARNVRLAGVRVDTADGAAVSAEQTENLTLFDVGSHAVHADTPVIELSNVKQAYVHGCFASPTTDVFLSVKGVASRGIVVDGNDLLGAKSPVVTSPDVRDRPVATGARTGEAVHAFEVK